MTNISENNVSKNNLLYNNYIAASDKEVNLARKYGESGNDRWYKTHPGPRYILEAEVSVPISTYSLP